MWYFKSKKINFILKKHRIKNIVHFAASTDVNESMDRPLKYYENNTISTEKFIQVCCKNNIKSLFFFNLCSLW